MTDQNRERVLHIMNCELGDVVLLFKPTREEMDRMVKEVLDAIYEQFKDLPCLK